MRFSTCLSVCILLTMAALLSCSLNGVAGIEVDSHLKGFILPNSKVLVGVSLEKIKQSDFYLRHKSQLDISALNQFSAQAGLDPRRDLSSLLLAWDGSGLLVMTRGDFNTQDLQNRLKAVTKAEEYNNFTLLGDGKRDVVFLPKGVALVGPAILLKKAVDEQATGRGGTPEDLQPQIARLDKDAQVWLVSNGVIPLDQLALRTESSSMLSNIASYVNATSVGVTFTSNVKVRAHLGCISAEGSQRVHDALRGVIGLARLSTKDDQLDQLKLWDSIKVEKQGNDVTINSELTPELTEKLLALIPALRSRI